MNEFIVSGAVIFHISRKSNCTFNFVFIFFLFKLLVYYLRWKNELFVLNVCVQNENKAKNRTRLHWIWQLHTLYTKPCTQTRYHISQSIDWLLIEYKCKCVCAYAAKSSTVTVTMTFGHFVAPYRNVNMFLCWNHRLCLLCSFNIKFWFCNFHIRYLVCTAFSLWFFFCAGKMNEALPYRVGYATEMTKCQKCAHPIRKDALKIAIMVQVIGIEVLQFIAETLVIFMHAFTPISIKFLHLQKCDKVIDSYCLCILTKV